MCKFTHKNKQKQINMKESKNYVSKQELADEIALCEANGRIISTKLANYFYLIANRSCANLKLKYKLNSEEYYDVIAEAVFHACRDWYKYKPDANNAFAYITQLIRFGAADGLAQKDRTTLYRKRVGLNPKILRFE